MLKIKQCNNNRELITFPHNIQFNKCSTMLVINILQKIVFDFFLFKLAKLCSFCHLNLLRKSHNLLNRQNKIVTKFKNNFFFNNVIFHFHASFRFHIEINKMLVHLSIHIYRLFSKLKIGLKKFVIISDTLYESVVLTFITQLSS